MSEKVLKTSKMTLQIIELLHKYDRLQLSAISDELDAHPSTIHGHLNTLKRMGYVKQEDQEYTLSLKLLKIGYSLLRGHDAFPLVSEYTKKLAKDTGYRSIFAVEDNGRGVFLATSSGEYPAWPHEKIGEEFYLHSTASGKAMLSQLSDERIEAIVEEWGVPQQTDNTITSRDELFEEIRTVRENGVAYNWEENTKGVVAVAVPVQTANGRFAGAFALNAPGTDVNYDELERSLPETLHLRAEEFKEDVEAL